LSGPLFAARFFSAGQYVMKWMITMYKEHMKKYILIALIAHLFILVWVALSVADTGSQRGKSAAASLLPDELKSVKVDDYFVGSNRSPAGKIENATGHVVVLHKDINRAYFAAAGDIVYQEDIFYTLKDSRCRIKFSTEDIITMGENSKIVADEIIDDQAEKKKSSVISMLKGKAMFYVVRLFRYKNVEATVKTSTAVMGVRGTKFGVEVRKTGEKVAGLSDESFIYLAQNEGNFETVVYGFEGTVDVTSITDGSTQTIGAGENLVLDNTGAGNVEQTDSGTARQFIVETRSDTATGGGIGGSGTVDDGTVEGGEGAGATGDTDEPGDADTESIAQTITGQSIETQVVSGNRVGYFSALLTRFDGTNTFLADVYTNSSRSDFNEGSVSGNSIVDSDGFIAATDTAAENSTPYLTKIKTIAGGPFDSGDLGTTRQMDNPENANGWPEDDRLGQNSYMQWGFWAMSRWVPTVPDPYSFAVTDRAYYVDGFTTPDAVVTGMAGDYTYAGSAWGTYFNGARGTDMVGTFACQIDMTAKTVTDFDILVSGGSYSASINNASGSFIGASGEFKITGGDWTLSNPSPMSIVSNGVLQPGASASCNGSLFGPNAEHMGGAWAMDYGSDNNAAVGIFVGDKGGTSVTPPLPPSINNQSVVN
jgi:hypothetical protein